MLLRHAHLFCEVCTRRSFSDAARVLAVSQPTVSAAVSQIEKELGVTLLDRRSRPLEITPAGRLYETGCRGLIDTIARLEDEVRSAGKRLAGAVKVAAIYSVGLLEIRTLKSSFEESHPEVSVDLTFCHPDEVYERLRTGRADLGLLAFPHESAEFESTPWQMQPMSVMVPPGHEWSRRTAIQLPELAGERFVSLKAGLRTRQHLDTLFHDQMVSVESVGDFDNFDTLRRAVAEGDGVSIVPSAIFEKDARLGLVTLVPLVDAEGQPDSDLVRPLGIVARHDSVLSSAAIAFRTSLLTMPAEVSSAGGTSGPAGSAKQEKTRKPSTELTASR